MECMCDMRWFDLDEIPVRCFILAFLHASFSLPEQNVHRQVGAQLCLDHCLPQKLVRHEFAVCASALFTYLLYYRTIPFDLYIYIFYAVFILLSYCS